MREVSEKTCSMVFFLLVFSILLSPHLATADLLVGTDGPPGDGAIRHFNNSGAYLGDFTSGGPGLDGPATVHFGPDGNLYVLSSSDTVIRYNGSTGVFIDVFIPTGTAGLDEAKDMVFGPDGNLYIAANENCFPCDPPLVGEGGRVMRFNGTTGDYIDDFIPNGAGTGGANLVAETMSIAFGPDGYFYLGNDARCVLDSNCNSTAYSVMRFDGTTGAYIDTPFPANAMGLYDPNSITVGPDCNLYISSEGISFTSDGFGTDNPNVIFRLNLTTNSISEFVSSNGLLNNNGPSPPGAGLIEPEKIVFGPSGDLYVTSGDTAEIYRYNGITGALIGVFVSQGLGAGTSDPKGITFFPGESQTCMAIITKGIPTLSEWGLVSMIGLIGMIGLWVLRSKKATN